MTIQVTENSCAKCGACTAVCPVYQATGQESLTARGRLHLLEKITTPRYSRAYLDIFSRCLLCGACRQVCPRGIDLPARVIALRSHSPQLTGPGSLAGSLVKGCLSHQLILAGIGKFLEISAPLLDSLPAASGLRLKLGLAAVPGHDRNRERGAAAQTAPAGSPATLLFPGCFARHLGPEITAAAAALVDGKTGGRPGIPAGQACCGLAFYSSGDLAEARRLARLNIAAFAGPALPIIVACGSCYSHLTSYPELLAEDPEWQPRASAFAARLRELSSFLADRSASAAVRPKSGKIRVVYHDPCHLRYRPGLNKAPRQLLDNLPGVDLVELPHGPQCCGGGGLFNLAHPDLAEQIAGKLLQDLLAVAPDLVVTTCSGCLIQLRRQLAAAGSPAKVDHLAQVLTEMTR